MIETTPLTHLPKRAPLRVPLVDGRVVDATFHHIDGMYSLCSIDDMSQPEGLFHLRYDTPMVEVDGRWEIYLEPDNKKTPQEA